MNNEFYEELRMLLLDGGHYILHTTRNSTHFTFDKWRDDGALVFLIPSRNPNQLPNRKAISRSVLVGDVLPTFKDCRRTVLQNLVQEYA